jgi:hypothetical protein
MATVSNPLGSFTYHYVNQTPRLSSVDRPGGQSVVYGYYGNAGDNRLSEIRNLGPGGVQQSKFNYTYDPVGNIRNWTKQVGAGSSRYYDLKYSVRTRGQCAYACRIVLMRDLLGVRKQGWRGV